MASKKLTREELETILTRRLSLSEPEFHLEKVGGRFVGDIISATFKGKRDHARQKQIWDALETELGNHSAALVGMLLAFTPQEWALNDQETPLTRKSKKAG